MLKVQLEERRDNVLPPLHALVESAIRAAPMSGGIGEERIHPTTIERIADAVVELLYDLSIPD